MRFSQGQKLIDFLRGKNSSSSDVKSIMNKITKELVNNGYKINEEENIIITPNNVKFYDNSSLYAIFEDFYKKEYGIILNDNSIFIDVGLNTATTSLYFATMENIKQIYAFEPFIPTYNCALENINLNPELAKKITTFDIGLDKENKEIKMPYNINQSGCMSSVYNPFEMNKTLCKEAESIETLKIRDAAEILTPIINKHYNKELIILKIDTEGSEFNIFESMDKENLFTKIDIVMLEYHYKSPEILEETLLRNNFTVTYTPRVIKTEVGMIFAFKNKCIK